MSLTATHTIDAPLADVWRWHTMPGAVHRLTPRSAFTALTPAVVPTPNPIRAVTDS